MSLGHKLRNLCACVPQLLQKVEIKIKHILVMFIKKKKKQKYAFYQMLSGSECTLLQEA